MLPPYSKDGMQHLEGIFLLLHVPIQWCRLWFGSVGNKTESPLCVAAFMGTSAWSCFVLAYFYKWQVYVLLFEEYLAAFLLGYTALEMFAASILAVMICDDIRDLAINLAAFIATTTLMVLMLAL